LHGLILAECAELAIVMKAGEGVLAAHYYFSGDSAPTILVDKEGKIILTNAMMNSMSDRLRAKLAEFFE